MSETSASLLERLQGESDPDSWQKLVDLYTPLIRGWLRQQAGFDRDADDVVQDVLAVVVRKLPEFRKPERPGAFRCWLRQITVNCLRETWRSRRSRPLATGDSDFLGVLAQLEDPESGLGRLWDQEYDRYVLGRLLESIEPHFTPATWQAFRRVTLEGAEPDRVARELGISVNAVFIAKSRVLSRLREEGRGLIG
jgi:RNA polymerase sigma-70 factor, ECF subfamily